MSLQSLWAILVISIGVAGCLSPDPSPSTSMPSTESGTGPRASNNETTLTPGELLLSSCPNGFYFLAILPRDLYPASPPPEWGSGPTPFMEVWIHAFRCDRISIDSFERGSLHFLYETHDNREAPPTCEVGDYQSSEMLNRVWVDDAELAAHLKVTYGMPVEFAQISHELLVDGQVANNVWTFGLPGQAASWLEARNATATDYGQTDLPLNRYYWVNNVGGISYMDFAQESRSSAFHRVVNGTLRQPFIYSAQGIEAFASDGRPFIDADASGPITQFRDLQCEQPF